MYVLHSTYDDSVMNACDRGVCDTLKLNCNDRL